MGSTEAVHPSGAATELEEYRRELTAYCYRMLGSAADAEDAVQETMIRAWRSLEKFEGRSALRSWVYRIATNVCFDALDSAKRRARPMDLGGPGEPPFDLWLRGRDDIFTWWFGPGIGCQGSKLVPARSANGLPAWGQYKPSPEGGYEPWALQVIEVVGGKVAELTFFLDTKTLFPLF